MPDIVDNAGREPFLPHEVVHGVDLAAVDGVLLLRPRVLLQGGDDGCQDQGHEPIFHHDLSEDGNKLLRGVLSGVSVVRTAGPVEAVDVQDHGLPEACRPVHEALHAKLDGGVGRRCVRQPRVLEVQLVLLLLAMNLEVDGVDLGEEPNASEPVGEHDEPQKELHEPGGHGVGLVGQHLEHQVDLGHRGLDLCQLQEPHVAQEIHRPGVRARPVRAHDAEDDRDGEHQNGQSRNQVQDEPVPQVMMLDEFLVHDHRAELVVPSPKVDEDIRDEDTIHDGAVPNVKVLVWPVDDPIVVKGREAGDEGDLDDGAHHGDRHDDLPDLGELRQGVNEGLVLLVLSSAHGLELHLQDGVFAQLRPLTLKAPQQGHEDRVPTTRQVIAILALGDRQGLVPHLVAVPTQARGQPAEQAPALCPLPEPALRHLSKPAPPVGGPGAAGGDREGVPRLPFGFPERSRVRSPSRSCRPASRTNATLGPRNLSFRGLQCQGLNLETLIDSGG